MNPIESADSKALVYTARLRRALGELQPGEVEDIVLEIRSHFAERLTGADDPEATVAEIIEALGNPEALASRYQTEAVLARGRVSQSPLTLLRAAQLWAMEGLFGLGVFLLGILGYGSAAALMLAALLKPFFPHHVGLWWNPPETVALGIVSGPPDPRFELLGWWIVPIGLVVGCLLWLLMTRVLRGLLRRHRAFISPLVSEPG